MNPAIDKDQAASIRYGMRVLRILSNKTRQDIINYIAAGQGTLTVTDIYRHFKTVQPTCSMYLRSLRNIGVLDSTKIGKCVYYRVDMTQLNAYINTAKKL